ncbi:hypothetical protein GQ53DRAFT_50576 [Thozetella sp. PMI_491]|nr:hypothetical protein GQ53DRAFT_50576 [Thozetella sp. PMI_491]
MRSSAESNRRIGELAVRDGDGTGTPDEGVPSAALSAEFTEDDPFWSPRQGTGGIALRAPSQPSISAFPQSWTPRSGRSPRTSIDTYDPTFLGTQALQSESPETRASKAQANRKAESNETHPHAFTTGASRPRLLAPKLDGTTQRKGDFDPPSSPTKFTSAARTNGKRSSDLGSIAKFAADLRAKGRKEGTAGSSVQEADDLDQERIHAVLLEAIKRVDFNAVRQLLSANPGAVNWKFGRGQETPLLLILRNANAAFLPAFIDTIFEFDVQVNVRDRNGQTPLISACAMGLRDAAALLLERGALIDVQDDSKNTALHEAVSARHDSVVQLLLRWRANPNTGNRDGRTPLHQASYRGLDSILDLLLLVEETDVNPRDVRSGYTPLHDAILRGHERAAKTLIQNGADVCAKSAKGWMPLHCAAQKGSTVIAESLLDEGAPPLCYTEALDTPETLAVKHGHGNIVELLNRKRSVHALGDPGSKSGKELHVSVPSPNQEEACRYFTGSIWPSERKGIRVDTMSVWEMLYGKDPKVKHLGRSNGARTPRWIHLPANNRTWVEDVFKLIYSADNESKQQRRRSTGAETPPSGSGGSSESALRTILHFIETEFVEIGRQEFTCSREPHFKCAVGPKPRQRSAENQMVSIVLPVIDVDGQQPYYYLADDDERGKEEIAKPEDPDAETPEARERRLLRKYTIKEGRPLSEQQDEHVQMMWSLGGAYQDLHRARSLDETFYELLPANDINYLNGDQVLSRFIARFRREIENESDSEDEEEEGNPEVDETEDSLTEKDGKLDGKNTQMRNGPNASTGAVKHNEKAYPTPSQLEKQDGTPGSRLASLRLLRSLGTVPTQLLRAARNGKTGKGNDASDASPLADSSGADSEAGSEGEEEESDLSPLRPRQQIIVVPQLWVWKVENIVVTAFPDRWDSSNPRMLSNILLANVEEQNRRSKSEVFEDMDVLGIMHTVLQTSLEFKPLFTAYEEKRSYHDAFAGEIAHLSSRVTASYTKYRKSLGRAEESFAAAVQEETELLVTIDDILNEISMLKRVQQDQALVFAGVKADYERIEGLKRRDGWPNQTPSRIPSHGPIRPQFLHHNTTGDLDRGPPLESQVGQLNPAQFQRLDAKLKRQEEDARRVRESIITLLDLRQRQASTENVINTGKQSQMLFEQSKVLFILSGATVIFAPLSWISSLLALKIDDFTPDSWGQGQAFGASIGSLLGTLLLCFVFWVVYDRYFYRHRDGHIGKHTATKA